MKRMAWAVVLTATITLYTVHSLHSIPDFSVSDDDNTPIIWIMRSTKYRWWAWARMQHPTSH